MNKPEKYHPSLFSKNEESVFSETQELVIPQNTLYDIPIQTQQTPMRRHVTIFGFSQSNRQNVIDQIEKCTKISRKEEGKNYINVWAEDTSSLDSLLKLNHKSINGEIIGAYRKNFGAVDDSDIYVKKKGLIRKIYEYLFGE